MARKKLYVPGDNTPYPLSRSKIDLFMDCPKCLYLDRRLGIGRPGGFPFTLNNAVDELLKREFDTYRQKQQPHPLMKENDINAIPFQHASLNEWRSNFRGVRCVDPKTNFEVSGAIDDLWINPETKEIMVVDYKATAKKDEVTLDADWQISYKRQAEVYQWLLRRNNFKVSDTAYFVYCNGIRDKDTFDQKLEFRTKVIPYEGNGEWIDGTLKSIHEVLNQDTIPEANPECEWCQYRENQAADF